MTQITASPPVLILHGLGMSTLRMKTLEYYLRNKDFHTLNIGYPSTSKSIADGARLVHRELQHEFGGTVPVMNVVGHSLGGLIALEMATQGVRFERMVMMGTPFGGSEVADHLSNPNNKFVSWLYTQFYGPAGIELTTAHRNKIIAQFCESEAQIGVISGTQTWEHLWFNDIMAPSGPHDSLVSLASTKIPGMADHIEVASVHGFLIETGAAHAAHFLTHGRFRAAEYAPA